MNIISGWFVGTCTNTTEGVSANLLLFIHGVTEGKVHGELGLSGELDGGGPFHGRLNDETMVFTTCVPAAQVVIEWRAQINAGQLSGTYSVCCDDPKMAASGLARSVGVWSCAFVRSPGAVDIERNNQAWVFDEGSSEGPLAVEEFAQQAAAGRWPEKAIVAMEDCTAWTTVGQFLAAKAANEN